MGYIYICGFAYMNQLGNQLILNQWGCDIKSMSARQHRSTWAHRLQVSRLSDLDKGLL